MVVDRSGIHRAHTLASTLAHWQGRFRLQFLPARGAVTISIPLKASGVYCRTRSGLVAVFLISSSSTGACVACSWRIKSSPSMPSGGSTFRLVFHGFCSSWRPRALATCGAVSKRHGTPRQRGGGNTHDHYVFCSCSPEMYELYMRACSLHLSRGYVDQQNSQQLSVIGHDCRGRGWLCDAEPVEET
jgi:hypothetical protein